MEYINVNNNNLNENIKSYKRYPLEFKEQILGVYKSGVYGKDIVACAKAYDIPQKTLRGWISNLNKNTTPNALLEQQAELLKLKKELHRIKMENEILKKAAIYFANQA